MLKKSLLLLVLSLSLISCHSSNDGFIRVKGTSLVNPDGSEYVIHGTNLGCWLNPEGYHFSFDKTANSPRLIDELFCQVAGEDFTDGFWKSFVSNFITEDDIRFLASSGVNTVRLPFHYKILTDEPYLGFKNAVEGFEILDKAIAWCSKYGIHVILDMHDCPAGQTGDNIDDSYGYPWLFKEISAQDKFVSIWKSIAERYSNDPTVLGYDLMNEPIAHYFPDKEELNAMLEPLMKRAAEAIRTVDKNHIVIFAGAQWNTKFEGVYTDFSADDNLMYSCHIYKCPPSVNSLKGFMRFRDMSGKPMYMGETGENTDEWVESFREALDSVGIGWTFWTYKRLDATRCFASVAKPEGWDSLVNFSESDRSTYKSIRDNMPDRDSVRTAMSAYLENCLFENCSINGGYVSALGFENSIN